MKPEAQALLGRAREDLDASQVLVDHGHFSAAASRAYYALFHAAEALLAEDGLRFSSHGAAHAAFGREFAKTGRVDPRYHRFLLDAFRQRQDADYNVTVRISAQDAREVLDQAREFVAMAESLLKGAQRQEQP